MIGRASLTLVGAALVLSAMLRRRRRRAPNG